MSQFSQATALHCRAAHRCRLGNLETHVECVPRPRHWGGSFELQDRRKCCCFIPALTGWTLKTTTLTKYDRGNQPEFPFLVGFIGRDSDWSVARHSASQRKA